MNQAHYRLDEARKRINICVMIRKPGKCEVGPVNFLVSCEANVLLRLIRRLDLFFCNNFRAISGRISEKF